MPPFQIHVHNLPHNMPHRPHSPIYYSRSQRHGSFDDSTSTPSSPSSASDVTNDFFDSGKKHRNRRRRRQSRVCKNVASPPHDRPMTKNDLYFALDCEMVGVGPEGLDSAVARVTICNWAEEVILDTYVQVPTEVTDYRTFVSGIQAKDLEGSHAMPLEQVRTLVKNTLHGKILIGHALENDLAALKITHPWHDIRDTANYPKFMKEIRDGEDRSIMAPRKLKELAWDHLGRDIQAQGQAHNPVEDARAALRLYKSERMQWEMMVMAQVQVSAHEEGGGGNKPSPRARAPSSEHSSNNRCNYKRGGLNQKIQFRPAGYSSPRNGYPHPPHPQGVYVTYPPQYFVGPQPLMPFH